MKLGYSNITVFVVAEIGKQSQDSIIHCHTDESSYTGPPHTMATWNLQMCLKMNWDF